MMKTHRPVLDKCTMVVRKRHKCHKQSDCFFWLIMMAMCNLSLKICNGIFVMGGMHILNVQDHDIYGSKGWILKCSFHISLHTHLVLS